MKFIILVFVSLGLAACSTCKCKSIDEQGKVRDASDPAPQSTEKTTDKLADKTAEKFPVPAAQADFPAVVPNAGVTTTEKSPAVASNATAPLALTVTAPGTTATTAATTTALGATIKVYKYDSSRQCGQGKSIDLDEMAKQLGTIKILSQEKKNDGMMRIQMCGAPTGVANVYEIEQKDLKKAAKVGFREWKYTQQ